MGRDLAGVVAGLAVLLLGVLAVGQLADAPEPAATEAVAPAATPQPGETQGADDLPGVRPAVTRVLRWSGKVSHAGRDDLGQLSSAVFDVLRQHQMPLMVPESGAGS